MIDYLRERTLTLSYDHETRTLEVQHGEQCASPSNGDKQPTDTRGRKEERTADARTERASLPDGTGGDTRPTDAAPELGGAYVQVPIKAAIKTDNTGQKCVRALTRDPSPKRGLIPSV